MNNWKELALIVGMMLVTFGVRYPVLALAGKVRMPPWLLESLRYVPVAVLSAIVVPMMLAPEGDWNVSISNEYLLAGLVSIGVAALGRHVLLTIVVGMGVFLALRFLI
ncbi:MAG: AzlD domain-containing protein [Granulosicoccus sp.]|nr:AzlD domain-containing protein [Granulosicoccus sp.]